MTVASASRTIHRLPFDRIAEAAAFIAALSRALTAPRDQDFEPGSRAPEVWSLLHSTGAGADVYLNDEALEATRRAFGDAPIAALCTRDALPTGCVRLIGPGHTARWGRDEAERHLLQADGSQ